MPTALVENRRKAVADSLRSFLPGANINESAQHGSVLESEALRQEADEHAGSADGEAKKMQ
jgi:hypothetical protein